MSALLQAKRVTKTFGGGVFESEEIVALRDFSLKLDVAQPSITAVVGESGSGKSTMARLLLGLETPTEGEILYAGHDVSKLSRKTLRQFRNDVQAVFQDPFGAFNSFYKVDHVLETPINKFGLATSREERQRLIERVLYSVGMRPEETLGRYPHQLSGGQRQRVMVARALLLRPKIIIADEPVSMIDASLRATVLEALRLLRDDFGISLIYITHDLTTAYQISDDIIVLYQGRVAEAGNVEQVVKQPKHPYTQLLVGSIPLPDPDQAWQAEAAASDQGQRAVAGRGCLFAKRCPHAFERCLDEAPPFYQTDTQRLTSCYLYADQPIVPQDEMNSVFIGKHQEAP